MTFGDLLGSRILVVEDDYLQSITLALALEDQGSDVVGPCADIQSSLRALDASPIDAAILDIRLGRDLVYDVADRLSGRNVPFMFVTGYEPGYLPDRFRNVRCLQKPIDFEAMTAALAVTLAERVPGQ